MAAAAGIFTAVVGISQAQSAKKAARRQTALAAEQQKATTDEEIRRQKYTHRRNISSIEAEIAAGGLSSTGKGLRGGKRTTTSVDQEIIDLQAQMDEQTNIFGDQATAMYGISTRLTSDDPDEDYDSASDIRERQERSVEYQNSKERLESLKKQQTEELALPWNPEGGIFAEYLGERESVHISEIEWMRRTGLSSVASIMAQGQSAASAAQAQSNMYLAKGISSAANWWESTQTPETTTTTVQTE